MGICVDCGKYIYNRKRCGACVAKFLVNYNKTYRQGKPASAISKYYGYYKFAITLTNTEISVIIGAKKHDIKHTKVYGEIKVLRTLIKILCDVYDFNMLVSNRDVEKEAGEEEDNERNEILKDGVYEND